MRGEVAISQLSYSCTKATEAVKTNCDNGDAVELYMSVVSVHATVTQLKTVVQTFDGQHAVGSFVTASVFSPSPSSDLF